MDELEVPLVSARRRVERDDRVRVQVVAAALGAVDVRARGAGAEDQQVALLVDRRGVPEAGAAQSRAVALPRRVRDRIVAVTGQPELPLDLAGLRVERRQPASGEELRTGVADVDETVVVDRRRDRGRVVLVPVEDLRLPLDLAVADVDRLDLSVDPRRVERVGPVVAQAARLPAAADRRDLRVEVASQLPDDLSGARVDGEDVVLARRDVEVAVDREDVLLVRVLRRRARVEVDHEVALQVGDVRRVDLSAASGTCGRSRRR